MDKVLYFNDLFAIYKELLTNREQEIFSFYYEENLSMGEIADNLKVSRASIGNTIKTVERKLEEYETILKINEKNKKILEICQALKEEKIKENLLELVNESNLASNVKKSVN